MCSTSTVPVHKTRLISTAFSNERVKFDRRADDWGSDANQRQLKHVPLTDENRVSGGTKHEGCWGQFTLFIQQPETIKLKIKTYKLGMYHYYYSITITVLDTEN